MIKHFDDIRSDLLLRKLHDVAFGTYLLKPLRLNSAFKRTL